MDFRKRKEYTHREIFSKSCQIKPKLDCIFHFLIDLEPNGILFGSKWIKRNNQNQANLKQTKFRWLPNQSGNGKCNRIPVWLSKISNRKYFSVCRTTRSGISANYQMLVPLGIMGVPLRVPLKPLSTIMLWCSSGFRGGGLSSVEQKTRTIFEHNYNPFSLAKKQKSISVCAILCYK